MQEDILHRIRGLIILFIVALTITSCGNEGQVIPRPDEARHTFDASEKILTKAIVQVMKDKAFSNPVIDRQKNVVESDYVIDGDWRTKAVARVNRISEKECEVVLSIITEKKPTRAGNCGGSWKRPNTTPSSASLKRKYTGNCIRWNNLPDVSRNNASMSPSLSA